MHNKWCIITILNNYPVVHGYFQADGKEGYLVLEKCANAECVAVPIDYLCYIKIQLTFAMREHIRKYFLVILSCYVFRIVVETHLYKFISFLLINILQNWLVCEDPACQHRTKHINPKFIKGFPECTKCKRSTMRREVRTFLVVFFLNVKTLLFITYLLPWRYNPWGLGLLHKLPASSTILCSRFPISGFQKAPRICCHPLNPPQFRLPGCPCAVQFFI